MPKTMEEEVIREKTSIKIKPEIWKEAKKQAIDEGKTVSELVEEAIKKWMKEHQK
jgi:predicted DNA-binding protein